MCRKLLFLALAISLGTALAERNVREFGAQGDGLTDDTKPIRRP
jgi:polygalacturonase